MIGAKTSITFEPWSCKLCQSYLFYSNMFIRASHMTEATLKLTDAAIIIIERFVDNYQRKPDHHEFNAMKQRTGQLSATFFHSMKTSLTEGIVGH